MGKSALLYECERLAKSLHWDVVNIGVTALWDPHQLLSSLGFGDKYEVTEKSTQVGLKNFFRRGYKNIRPKPTVEDILKDEKEPLLLILDEAQALLDENVPPSQHIGNTIRILELIHNGKLGRPIVLLTAGLDGITRGGRKLKISGSTPNLVDRGLSLHRRIESHF